MRRVSVSLNDTLAEALASYTTHRPDDPAASDILRAALGEYLAARGYLHSEQHSQHEGNCRDDVSSMERHDTSQDHTMETIDAYIIASAAVPPTPPSVLEALRRYLSSMGVLVPQGPLRVPQFRLIEDESGHTDTSIEHDRVLAESHQ